MIEPHLAGVDADVHRGSVGLLSLHTLNVDDVLLPVDLHYLANLLAFVVSTDNLHSTKMENDIKKQHHPREQNPNANLNRSEIRC